MYAPPLSSTTILKSFMHWFLFLGAYAGTLSGYFYLTIGDYQQLEST